MRLDRKMISLCRQVNIVAINILIPHCKNKEYGNRKERFWREVESLNESAGGFVLASRKLNQ